MVMVNQAIERAITDRVQLMTRLKSEIAELRRAGRKIPGNFLCEIKPHNYGSQPYAQDASGKGETPETARAEALDHFRLVNEKWMEPDEGEIHIYLVMATTKISID